MLVQLCWALLLLHLATLASNLKGAMPPPCCVGVALLLHLFLLSAFCWMLVEGLLLYQLLITVFQSANSKFVLKRLVFAWGESSSRRTCRAPSVGVVQPAVCTGSASGKSTRLGPHVGSQDI